MFKALVVDDDDAVRRMVALFLENEGFLVRTACSAASGIPLLAEEHPDIVITDLKMESPLAGYEVVTAAKQVAPRPVIVILTAFPVPRSDWLEAGADALFLKGENTIALPKQLLKLLTRRVSG